ncbi:MAG: hypothetical protein KF791_18540 [Verrucomicrobiae bacterium]|nr:hypothetical protein [Verrucomicrobiae bacterium]
MQSCRFPPVFLGLLVLGAGCGPREEVRVYEAPRDVAAPPTTSDSGAPAAAKTASNVPWTVPEGWDEKPSSPGGMRIASYGVTTGDGRSMDVSVIPLPGGSGSVLENVNRWRDQVGLGPLTEDQLDSERQTVTIGTMAGELFEMVGDRPVLDGGHRARTLAAMMRVGETTVFFKATGEEALVAANRPKFLAWLQSVQTGPAPATASTAPGSMAGPVAPPPVTGLPQWEVPSTWKPVPASTMRLASFAIEGSGGPPGDLSVVALGPGAGGVLANVNRWRGQLQLDSVDEAALARDAVAFTTQAGDEAVVVDLAGRGDMDGTRVLAAIVPRSDRTWFYKLTGDTALVASQKDAFLGFIRSVKYP